MQYYKALDNSLHCIESAFAYLLPEGCITITEEEAIALQNKPVASTVQDKLARLDAENALTQRNLRETIMLMTEAFKTVTGGAVDLSQIPGVAKVYEVEAEAANLRSQL